MSNSGKRRKRQVHRLEDLEVSSISLVDRPAIDIEFLVLKRYDPETEEGPMAKKKEDELEKGTEGDAPEEEAKEEEVTDETAAEVEPDEKPEADAEEAAAEPGMMAVLKDALEKVAGGELPADIRVAVQALLGYTERATKQDGVPDEAQPDYGPTDFDEAWVDVETDKALWEALSIFNRVVTAIYESADGNKVGLLVKAIEAFAAKAKAMMGAIKEEPAEEEAVAEEASEQSDTQLLATALTDLSTAFGEEMGAVKGQLLELEKRIAGEAPEPEASTEGDAAEETEKPVTLADVQKVIAAAIAKAKQPQYKGLLPEPEKDKDEEPEVPVVHTAKERAETLRQLNERLHGVKPNG
jgi:hypothetical protein